jgi:hypothetical protein
MIMKCNATMNEAMHELIVHPMWVGSRHIFDLTGRPA